MFIAAVSSKPQLRFHFCLRLRICQFAFQNIDAAKVFIDIDELGEHGFSQEDGWDIAAIAAFFGMSNRMANVTSMRPNDEFYTMGRG